MSNMSPARTAQVLSMRSKTDTDGQINVLSFTSWILRFNVTLHAKKFGRFYFRTKKKAENRTVREFKLPNTV